jgi:hypothetical protein
MTAFLQRNASRYLFSCLELMCLGRTKAGQCRPATPSRYLNETTLNISNPISLAGIAVAIRPFLLIPLNEQGNPIQHSLVGRFHPQGPALLNPIFQLSASVAHLLSLSDAGNGEKYPYPLNEVRGRRDQEMRNYDWLQ